MRMLQQVWTRFELKLIHEFLTTKNILPIALGRTTLNNPLFYRGKRMCQV
jgi:hypothetical protein